MLSKAKNPARQHNQVFHSDRYWWEFIFHAPFEEGQSDEQSEKKKPLTPSLTRGTSRRYLTILGRKRRVNEAASIRVGDRTNRGVRITTMA